MDELQGWLEESWDPDLTVGEWWERLGMSGWAAPLLPADCYGRGLSRGDALAAQQTITKFGALGAPMGLGLMLAAPTIATHGRASRSSATSPISSPADGRGASCSASPGPAPTSPVSRLEQSATATCGTSTARRCGPRADRSPTSACSSPAPTPRRRSIKASPGSRSTCTRRASRSVPARDDRPRDVQRGLPHRRSRPRRRADRRCQQRLGSGQHDAAVRTLGHGRGWRCAGAGRVDGDAGHGRRALAAARRRLRGTRRASGNGNRSQRSTGAKTYIDLAKSLGRNKEPAIRQDLARLHTLSELARYNTERHKAVRAAGGDIPGLANFTKLSMADVVRLQPRPRSRAARRARHAPRVRRRWSQGTRSRAGRCRGDHGDQPGPRSAGAADLRRHRSDPAQHHQRARRWGCRRSRATSRRCRSPSSRRTAEWLSPRRERHAALPLRHAA